MSKRCPRCGSTDTKPCRTRPRERKCYKCLRRWSVLADSEQRGSHVAPVDWERAAAFLFRGGTARGLMRELGVGQDTAWQIASRLGYDNRRRQARCADAAAPGVRPQGRPSQVVTCPKCHRDWERWQYTISKVCAGCRTKYKRELNARKARGNFEELKACAVCGRRMSRASKRDRCWTCCWHERKTAISAETERKRQWEQEQRRNPTTERGWLWKAEEELQRARGALRDQAHSRTGFRLAETSPTS